MQKFKKVLLIDDDAIVNEINKAIINKAEFASEVEVRDCVNSALELIQHANQENDLPDVVFLDINMPVRNGWDFIQDYEKLAFNQQRPPIVMVTSSNDPSDRARAMGSESVIEYITKPISKDSLEKLTNYSGQRN